MKEKGLGKKLLSLLLVFSMLTTLIPSTFIRTVDAAESETTYVLAGSDFQARGGHDAGATIVSGLLDKIKVDYPKMDGFLFAGDYDVNYNDVENGIAKLQETVRSQYSNLSHEIYIEGNHDSKNYNLVGDKLSSSGANDADGYGVFVINESDYMWYNDDEATIKKTAANLESYLNAKRNASYTKPIFVISHLPLHYSMRTRSGGKDGMHANYIFDVLNKAGNAGLNIIFMFGHNHSHGWDDYLGGAAIFLTKGNKINIAQNSTTVFKEETLAFTYMNAGYVGYYGDSYTSNVDKTLTMTTFAITNDNVTISRYDSKGTHDLKSAGVYNVEYPDSAYYSTDTTTVGSPFTLTLNKEITPAGEEVTPPSGGNTGSETTERTYTRVTNISELTSGGKYLLFYNGSHFMLPEVVEKSNSSGTRKGFNIESTSICGPDTITGDYSTKEWVLTSKGTGWLLGNGTQYAKLTKTSNYSVTATLENSGDTFTIGGSTNNFTFSNGTYVLNYNSRGVINGYASDAAKFYIYKMTDEGSNGSSVETTGGNWITITEPGEGQIRYVYELDKDGIDTGVEYLIVANDHSKALTAAASSNNSITITIDGEKAYADSDTYGWSFKTYYNNVYYIRLNGSTYLRNNKNQLGSSTNEGSNRRWIITNNNNGSYKIVSNSDNSYELRWSNSGGVFEIDNKADGPVRLYKYVKTEDIQATEGLYGKISGELTYNVANGTSADAALQAVKDGITVYYTNDKNASTGTVYPDDEKGMTWTLDPNYNPTTGGEYSVTIAYNGISLGVAKVVVPSVNVSGYSVEPLEGTVNKGASQSSKTGSLIYVQLENGKYYTVPVTVAMLTKADGSAVSTGEEGIYRNLTLTYNGVVISKNFILNVVTKTGNNYPEYPNEGAVKVNKTGTGIDFQSSGIAQVEISASGVPMKKGADVIVMLDLSSSMTSNKIIDNNVEKTRLKVLEESMVVLMNQLQGTDAEGNPMDIRIAVADFNRYYLDSSSPYYINSSDHMTNGSIRTNIEGTNKVYTGSNKLDANAFVDVHSLANNSFSGFETKSGTNYDYAFDVIYQLGESITNQNEINGEDRDLFVIFMSDGAPFQYNYFSSQSDDDGATYWNNWLLGTMTDSMFANNSNKSYYNEDGKHWMAEAIKGDPSLTYPVIRKNDSSDTDKDNWVNVNGLGAKMYSIGFCLAVDKQITVDSMDTVISNIATSDQYYFRANTASNLSNAFAAIGGDIAYAAYNARFVDQMGDDYDLQLKNSTYDVVENGSIVSKTITPVIEILSYDIYTKAEADAGLIPEGKNIGDRKGKSNLLEVVKFSEDGKNAYSNLIDVDKDSVYGVVVNNDGTYTIADPDDNILKDDGVIYATTFFYNTNVNNGVAISEISIPTGKDSNNLTTGTTNELPAETFYWKMGTVQTSELAMKYYVYLEGSMEGTREGGSYPTNEYATLYYDNYLHNPCYKDTVSPVMAWKEANVSYAFYLVDENGNIIVNQTTGQTGSFANKIAVTNPVVHETVLLNSDEEVSSIDIASLGVLPEGYELYDCIVNDDGTKEGATYTVKIKSNTTGEWEITSVKDVQTTYVTQYNPDDTSAYSNDLTEETIGHDYTHTVVWFAVLWKVQALPDTVVIDYGLPVEISVLTNDMFGENGVLSSVGKYSDSLNLDGHDTTLASGFASTYSGTYGNAETNTSTGKIKYTLNKTNGMQMKTYEKFAYAVNYTGNENAGYYYDIVTVIPATTIYYEDDYITFSEENTTNSYGYTQKGWEKVGTTLDGNQAEDRPGQYSLVDANNIYGYDSVNENMTTYSMGSAMKTTIKDKEYATATFDFFGTGFDIVSLTSNTSGSILVNIYPLEDNGDYIYESGKPKYTQYTVDTYYGYSYKDGNWELIEYDENNAENTSTCLYQIPIIEVKDLAYGRYKVILNASYLAGFDHTTPDGYELYLDAVRIYDPANDGLSDGATDNTIENAYKADGESYPLYTELRDQLTTLDSFESILKDENKTKVNGVVFIDGIGNNKSVVDYKNYGPNNELYLAPGQIIAFEINKDSFVKSSNTNVQINPENIHLGFKSANGDTVSYKIYHVAPVTADDGSISRYEIADIKENTVSTTTSMFRDIEKWANGTIVIENIGSTGILSLTDIKFTFTENAQIRINDEGNQVQTLSNDTRAITFALSRMNYVAPTTFVPEVFEVTVDEIVEVGTNVNVNVTTSTDVEYIYVNDSIITDYVENNGLRTFTTTLPTTEVGTMEVYVQAYNVDGLEAETQCYAEVEVTEKTFTPKTFEVDVPYAELINKKFKVTVKTSTDVEYITVNGETFTSFKTNKAKGTRTWTINLTAKQIGKFNVDVVAYDKDNTASETITNVVEITSVKKIVKDILDWIFG